MCLPPDENLSIISVSTQEKLQTHSKLPSRHARQCGLSLRTQDPNPASNTPYGNLGKSFVPSRPCLLVVTITTLESPPSNSNSACCQVPYVFVNMYFSPQLSANLQIPLYR